MPWQVPSGSFIVTKKFDDPVQGSCDSCIFLAGLCSYAWTNPATFPPPKAKDASNYYTFNFYPGGVSKTVKVSEKLCIESGVPKFASSNEANELWPSLYEKAYAAFINAGRNSVTVDTFVMGSVPFGRNGAVTMQDLANMSFTETAISSIADVYGFIKAKCTSGATNKPMIAWTYNDPAKGYDDKLSQNHTYSVLGVHPTNTNYIMLRNPYGTKRGDPVDPAIVLRSGTITMGAPVRATIDLANTSDGIFALHKDTFKSKFYKLAFSP